METYPLDPLSHPSWTGISLRSRAAPQPVMSVAQALDIGQIWKKPSCNLKLWGTVSGSVRVASYAVIEDTKKTRTKSVHGRGCDPRRHLKSHFKGKGGAVAVNGEDQILSMEKARRNRFKGTVHLRFRPSMAIRPGGPLEPQSCRRGTVGARAQRVARSVASMIENAMQDVSQAR